MRIICVYDICEVKYLVYWGFLLINEICVFIIEFYLKGNWMGFICFSFKFIFLCKLEIIGVVNGCDFNGFFGVLYKDVRIVVLF